MTEARVAKTVRIINNTRTPEEQAERDAKRAREAEEWKAQAEKRSREEVPNRIAELRRELTSLEGMQGLFPDLRRHEGRWKKVVFYSPAANSGAVKYEHRYNCGCCHDSPLEVWPYQETPFGRVYSSPPSFQVGEKDWNEGSRPYPGWRAKLEGAGIPNEVIESVALLFNSSEEVSDLEPLL